VPPASIPQNRCVVCHQGGKLGGHHCAEDTVEWIHKSCHRRLHQRDKLSRRERRKLRAQERALRPTAC